VKEKLCTLLTSFTGKVCLTPTGKEVGGTQGHFRHGVKEKSLYRELNFGYSNPDQPPY